jgi:hypothetical protein
MTYLDKIISANHDKGLHENPYRFTMVCHQCQTQTKELETVVRDKLDDMYGPPRGMGRGLIMSDSVEVATLPDCDLCRSMRNVYTVASYDGRTVYGPWANMCDDCFICYGVGLGTGKGQALILHNPNQLTLMLGTDTQESKGG